MPEKNTETLIILLRNLYHDKKDEQLHKQNSKAKSQRLIAKVIVVVMRLITFYRHFKFFVVSSLILQSQFYSQKMVV